MTEDIPEGDFDGEAGSGAPLPDPAALICVIKGPGLKESGSFSIPIDFRGAPPNAQAGGPAPHQIAPPFLGALRCIRWYCSTIPCSSSGWRKDLG